MRRLFVVLLLAVLWCVSGLPLGAAPFAALGQRLERQINNAKPIAAQGEATPAAKPATGIMTRNADIIQALDKVILHWDDPDLYKHITPWNQFVEENGKEVARVEQRAKLINQQADKIWEIVQKTPVTWGNKQPDYGQYAKQIPYIYVTDASSHCTQAIVNEVKQVLSSVRRANPQAHILLAMEFAEIMGNLGVPIRFAGQPNDGMYTQEPYVQLFSSADELNIDILALDDTIMAQETSTGKLYYKIGSRFILMDHSNRPDFIKNPSNLEFEEYSKLRGFVGISTLGMRLRNEQWANYINAVKPFYDIVITYTGDGHTNSELNTWVDFPILVGEKYITFNFYATEKNLQEQNYQETSYKILCDNHACSMVPISPTNENFTQPRITPTLWGKNTIADTPVWDGKSVLYIQTVDAEIEKYLKSLPEEQQRIIRELENELPKIGSKDNKWNVMNFDIFLPEYPKYPFTH